MNDDQVRASVGIHQRKIEECQNRIEILREEHCSHSDVDRVNKSNTGGYDPNNDSYWAECKCNICGDRWMEDQITKERL